MNLLWTLVYKYLFESLLSILLNIYSEVELLNYVAILSGTPILFPTATAPFYTTNSAQRFWFLHILTNTCSFLGFFFGFFVLVIAILMSVKWNLIVVLIFILLIIFSKVSHLLTYFPFPVFFISLLRSRFQSCIIPLLLERISLTFLILIVQINCWGILSDFVCLTKCFFHLHV